LETISCPSYKFTVVDGMEGVAAPKLKSLKLKLNPTGVQKATLAQMAGCCRFTYNQAVSMALTKGSTHKDVYRIRDRHWNARVQAQPRLRPPIVAVRDGCKRFED